MDSRDAANIWQRDYTELWNFVKVLVGTPAWPSVFYNEQLDVRLLVHGDDFVALGDDAGQAHLQNVLHWFHMGFIWFHQHVCPWSLANISIKDLSKKNSNSLAVLEDHPS